MISVTLGFPPSINHYYRARRGGGRFISKEGKRYREDVIVMCLQSRVKTTGPVALTIKAFPPDLHQRDLDNLLKALLDALQAAGAIDNDKNVRQLHMEWGNVRTGGMVVVEIERM